MTTEGLVLSCSRDLVDHLRRREEEGEGEREGKGEAEFFESSTMQFLGILSRVTHFHDAFHPWPRSKSNIMIFQSPSGLLVIRR